MSKDNKKNKFEGDTFNEIVQESMHKSSNLYAVTKLLESFDDEQKEDVLKTVKGLASVVDKLKLLVEKVEEQESNDG
tara:strand:- start:248 stop:478 length:231 start_codon:yes stop_codon:yes gene_type:complete